MKRQLHWLSRVADILAAETGDLRNLAKIAGEDPSTFYIGTDLTGCDIRGQDLRGMQLPNFDLGKVIWDEKTKVDPAYGGSADTAPEANEAPHALVLWNARGGRTTDRKTRGVRARIFTRATAPDFFNSDAPSDTPRVMVGASTASLLAPEAISAIPVPPSRSFIGRIREHSQSDREGPLVLIPVSRQPPSNDPLYGAVGDFVAFTALNPTLMRKLLNANTISAFCSARGAGMYPRLDAVARIYAALDAAGAGIVSNSVSLFQFGELTPPESLAADLLFPNYSTVYGRRPSGWNEFSRASALATLAEGKPLGEKPFIDAVTGLLENNGWNISSSNRDVNSFQIINENNNYEINLDNTSIYSSDSKNVDIDFNRIHISISASEEQCALAFRNGHILVGLSDCTHFGTRHDSIWNLIATQAARVASTRTNRIRWQYFSPLIKLAIARSKIKIPNWIEIIAESRSPQFHFNIYFVDSRKDGITLLFGAIGASKTTDPIVRFTIDSEGPRINESIHPAILEKQPTV